MSPEGSAFIAATVGSLVLTLALGFWLMPDVELYTSGLGLFPSPLGTLLGSLGVGPLAVVHALAVGAIFAGLVLLRPPLLSVVLAAPVLIWVGWLGVDAVAAVLVAWGYLRGRRLGLWLGAGVHLAALPMVVLVGRRRSFVVAFLVGGLGLWLTPYGGALGVLIPYGGYALFVGLIVAALSVAPGFSAGVPTRELLPLGFAVAVSVSYAAAWDLSRGVDFGNVYGGTLRYGLPVVLISLARAGELSSDGRARRPTTAASGRVEMRKRLFSVTALLALAALFIVPAALAQTVPAVPVSQYGDSLLTSLASAIGQIFPYAAAITAFAIGVGMVKRWLGHRKATKV